jgi:chromosome segregation ATPase
MKTFILGPAVVAFLVAGCTGSTNPADAGLFDNIRNLETGEYDRQIAAKEAEAAAITRANANIAADNSAKQAQTVSNSALIADLKAEIRALRMELSAIRSRASADPAKLDRIEGQIAAVEADLAGGGDPSALSAEVRRLKLAVRALAN